MPISSSNIDMDEIRTAFGGTSGSINNYTRASASVPYIRPANDNIPATTSTCNSFSNYAGAIGTSYCCRFCVIGNVACNVTIPVGTTAAAGCYTMRLIAVGGGGGAGGYDGGNGANGGSGASFCGYYIVNASAPWCVCIVGANGGGGANRGANTAGGCGGLGALSQGGAGGNSGSSGGSGAGGGGGGVSGVYFTSGGTTCCLAMVAGGGGGGGNNQNQNQAHFGQLMSANQQNRGFCNSTAGLTNTISETRICSCGTADFARLNTIRTSSALAGNGQNQTTAWKYCIGTLSYNMSCTGAYDGAGGGGAGAPNGVPGAVYGGQAYTAGSTDPEFPSPAGILCNYYGEVAGQGGSQGVSYYGLGPWTIGTTVVCRTASAQAETNALFSTQGGGGVAANPAGGAGCAGAVKVVIWNDFKCTFTP